MAVGFALGYYLGTRAAEHRHHQLQSLLGRLGRSQAMEEVADRVRHALRAGNRAIRSRAGQEVRRRMAATSRARPDPIHRTR